MTPMLHCVESGFRVARGSHRRSVSVSYPKNRRPPNSRRFNTCRVRHRMRWLGGERIAPCGTRLSGTARSTGVCTSCSGHVNTGWNYVCDGRGRRISVRRAAAMILSRQGVSIPKATFGVPPAPPKSFKSVPGFPGYALSRSGVLISCRAKSFGLPYVERWSRRKWNLQKETRSGVRGEYYAVNVRWADGSLRQVRLHVLLLITYIGPRPRGLEACHNDGDSLNNKIINLRWDTRGANQRDRNAHGRGNFGEHAGGARLTVEKVRTIRASNLTPLALSKKYKVHRNTIYAVLACEIWQHVR